MLMTKSLLVLGASALALTGITTAAPATAKRYTNMTQCTKYRHGRCVAWHRLTRKQARRAAQYRVGYRFGPSYGYTAYSALPQTYVTRYNLRPNYRYVYRDNYVYVVNPRTYAVERVLDALTR